MRTGERLDQLRSRLWIEKELAPRHSARRRALRVQIMAIKEQVRAMKEELANHREKAIEARDKLEALGVSNEDLVAELRGRARR